MKRQQQQQQQQRGGRSRNTTTTTTTTSTSTSTRSVVFSIGIVLLLLTTIVSIAYYRLGQYMKLQLLFNISNTNSKMKTTTRNPTTTTTHYDESPLYDKTLIWDNTKYPHVWLEYEQQQQQQQAQVQKGNHTTNTNTRNKEMISKPPYMILLTSYGWNHPNQKHIGLYHSRCYRSTEYIQSIINHPYFHPTAYNDIIKTYTSSQSQQSTSTTTSSSSISSRIIDPTIQYYVFLDVETCYESNYPNYGKSYYGNCDDGSSSSSSSITSSSSSSVRQRRIQFQRKMKRMKYTSQYIKYFHPLSSICYNFNTCHYIQKELMTNPIFMTSNNQNNNTTNNNNNNKLIVLDCRGNGQSIQYRTEQVTNTALVLVSLSSTKQQLLLGNNTTKSSTTSSTDTRTITNQIGSDQGLPPPAIKKVQMSHEQYMDEMMIECSSSSNDNKNNNNNNNNNDKYRPYYLAFSGDYKRHPVRQELSKLDNVRNGNHTTIHNNNNNVINNDNNNNNNSKNQKILITDTKELYKNTNGLSYVELLLSSQYFAVPRGDNLYSYRFSEVLSAGSIPILIDNMDWVLPFRSEIIDWDQCVIRIDGSNVIQDIQQYVLNSIGTYEQCRRRQYCYNHIYIPYMQNTSATIQGIIDGLQAML